MKKRILPLTGFVLALVLSAFLLISSDKTFEVRQHFLYWEPATSTYIDQSIYLSKKYVNNESRDQIPAIELCMLYPLDEAQMEESTAFYLNSMKSYGWTEDVSKRTPLYREFTRLGPMDDTAVTIFSLEPGVCSEYSSEPNAARILIGFRDNE